MAELEHRLALCDRHVADLALRIASLKENSLGSGIIAAHEVIALLEQTLESWQEAKRNLLHKQEPGWTLQTDTGSRSAASRNRPIKIVVSRWKLTR